MRTIIFGALCIVANTADTTTDLNEEAALRAAVTFWIYSDAAGYVNDAIWER